MKLVIDIPEDVKNRLCFGITYQKDIQTVCEALDNGIPLDKIKAEMDKLPSYVAKFAGGSFAIHIDKEKVLQILDKCKGESEGSE